MHTLLIGDMERLDRLYHWLELSTELFDVELILSENELTSKYYSCPVKPLDFLNSIQKGYDIVFLCSSLYESIKKILSFIGIPDKHIVTEMDMHKYLSKENTMNFYSESIYFSSQAKFITDEYDIGNFTYGEPTIWNFSDVKLSIGKFCSIAPGVTIILGGEHRIDWCSTYPFTEMMPEFSHIKGHPHSKGNVVIGNDVWIGMDSKIMSGVHIGNGSVISAGAVVTKDVEPYSIVSGIPAKIIRKRFDEKTILKLEEIQWWNWSNEQIYDAIPVLQSNRIEQLFEYYDTVVCPSSPS